MVNGQWTLDTTSNAGCSDGTTAYQVLNSHYTWDPDSLAGTVQVTFRTPACGNPAGTTSTDSIPFRHAP